MPLDDFDFDLFGGMPSGCQMNLIWLILCVLGGLAIAHGLGAHWGWGIGAGILTWVGSSIAYILWDASLSDRRRSKRRNKSERDDS